MFLLKAPYTGDESQILLYAIICGVAAVAMIGLIVVSVIMRKKKEKKEDSKEE